MAGRKRPSDESSPNKDFSKILVEVGEYERDVNRNVHKYNIYRKAAAVIANHPTKLKSGEEARKLAGVGEKIAKKLDEIIQTGKLRKLEEIRKDDYSTAVRELSQVSGIGPVKAQKLVKLGIKSVKELSEKQDEHELTHHQLIGLKYHEDFIQRIPHEEITKVEEILKKEISSVDSQFHLTICGSYRRGLPTSGDIDLLLTHPSFTSSETSTQIGLLKKVVDHLTEVKVVIETISLGKSKFMGVCRLEDSYPARRLDIRLTPHDQYFCSILYFTGSDEFNREMRAHAQSQGYTLSEYSLRPIGSTGKPGEPVEITSEEDVFLYINYDYKSPEQRNM